MLFAFFLKGIAVGIVIAIPVGPVGILCVRRTIFDSRLAGFVSGLGAATGDAMFAIIAGFGLTAVANLLIGYQNWLRAGGGAFLVVIGISALAKELPVGAPQRVRDTLLRDYVSTFALTVTNPVTILAFAAIFTAIGLSGEAATWAGAAILVAGVWVGSLLWWLAVIFGAGAFLPVFEPRHLEWINRISGVILLASGLALVGGLAVEYWR